MSVLTTCVGRHGRFYGALPLTLLVLIFASAVLADDGDAIAIGKTVFRVDARCRRPAYNLSWPLQGAVDALAPRAQSMAFVFAYEDGRNYCRIDLGDGRWRATRVDGREEHALGEGTIELPADTLLSEFALRRRQDRLTGILGGRILFRLLDVASGRGMAASWSSHDGAIGPARRQPVAEEEMVFGDDFMRAAEEPADGVWHIESGEWGLRSYADQWRGESPMDTANTSRNANPFVYRGVGAPDALAVTGQPFWDDVSVTVSVRPQTGKAGLVVGWAAADDYTVLRWEPSSIWEEASRLALDRVREGRAETLAEACFPGQRRQWVKLGVECRGAELAVRLQGHTVLRATDPTFQGGKIGLSASDGDVDFDDVRVRPCDLHPFVEPAIREQAETRPVNAWECTADFARCRLGKDAPQTGSLVLGTAGWQPRRMAVTVDTSAAKSATVGLCFGMAAKDAPEASVLDRAFSLFGSGDDKDDGSALWPGPSEKPLPGFVFLWDAADTEGARRRLVQRSARGAKTLADVPGGYPLGKPLRLIAECNEEALEIREGTLGLLVRIPQCRPDPGRIGVLTGGAAGTVEFRDFVIDGPSERDWERPVTTQVFTTDFYMLDWAAPEGDWVAAPGEGASGQRWWHKGDFYGAFSLSMPLVATQTPPGARLFLGATEEQPETGYELALRPVGGSGRRFSTVLSRQGKVVAKTTVHAGEGEETVAVYRDGPFLWLRCGDREPLSVRVGGEAEDASFGTRLGLELPWVGLLETVTLRRDHVMDDQFDRASVSWRGIGRWEMSNKFACDPRWGYMVGESDGLAALWHTDSFPGDMTLEFYAGMRYRPKYYGLAPYYPRPGDINAAFAESADSPFGGYTAVVSGWDTTWTRFLKRGEIVAETDKPLVPSTRRIYPKPRDLHRRWFYVKVRRRGAEMEMYFDNEKVLSWRDDGSFPADRLGLWTYDNSIVLARVKVSYSRRDRFCPSPVPPPTSAPVRPAPPAAPDGESEEAPPLPRSYTFDTPAEMATWQETGDTGDARIAWSPAGRDGGCLRAVNVHTGGEFRVAVPLPELHVRDTRSRIRFSMKMTAGTRINLYAKVAGKWYFLQMTGPVVEDENLVRLGAADTAADGRWHAVDLALGQALLRLRPMDEGLRLAELYFGVRRGDYLLAGLGGNPAGAEFAIDDFQIVCPERPAGVSVSAVSPEPSSRWGGDSVDVRFETPDVPLWRLALKVDDKSYTLAHDAVDFDFDAHTLRFDPVAASLPLVHDKAVSFSVELVEEPENSALKSWELVFGQTKDTTPPSPVRVNECLIRDTFERDLGEWRRAGPDKNGRDPGALLVRDGNRAASGRYSLKLFNEHMGGDAGAAFTTRAFHGGKSPLLTFDCLMEEEVLTDVLLTVGAKPCRITLTDNGHRNRALRIGAAVTDLAPDGEWHRVAVNLRSALLGLGTFEVSGLRIGDYYWTGNREGATYWIDNMTLVPCFSSAGDGFALSWGGSEDATGVAGYSYHWSRKAREDADTESEGEGASATFASLPDGPNYLHIRPVDARGNWGETTDWLVLIDNTPPRIASVWPEPGSESASTTLGVAFDAASCPGVVEAGPTTDIDPTSLQLTVNSWPFTPASAGVAFDPDTNRLTVDWTAAGLFTGPPEDGQSVEIELSPVRDFAGNECEGKSWKWTFRRGKDSHPPLAPVIRWQDGAVVQQLAFEGDGKRMSAVIPLLSDHPVDEELGTHIQRLRLDATGFSVTTTMPGSKVDTSVHRYLAFRYRFPPELMIDLIGTVDDEDKEKRSMVMKLTDAFVRPDYVVRAGRVDGIVCDNAWHHVVVDLQHHMRAREHLAPDAEITDWTIASLRFGDYGYNWNDFGTTFCLDDVVLFGAGPAEARFSLSAKDESDIAGFACSFSPDPNDVPPEKANVPVGEPYGVTFPSSGLWYVHARAQDNAGNWSKTAHLPYVKRDE